MKRIDLLDTLRGLAVLGLLFAHFPSTGGTAASISHPPALGWGAFHGADWVLTAIFVDGAMRGLFATLFGASMVLMVEAGGPGEMEHREARFAARCSGLLVLGAAHVVFAAWAPDILWIYALAGLAVLVLRPLPAGVLFALGGLAMALLTAYASLTDVAGGAPAPAELAAETAQRDGPYFAQVRAAAATWWSWLSPASVLVRLCEAGGYMLFGAALMKAGLLTAPSRRLALFALAAGLPVGAALCGYAALHAIETEFAYVADLHPLMRLGKPFIVAAWIGGVALVLSVPRLGCRVRAILGPVGRIALTGYVGSSVAMLVLFTGAGFALHGRFDRLELAGLAGAGAVALIIFANLWTRFAGQGPLERLLRWHADTVSAQFGESAPTRSRPGASCGRPGGAGAGRSG